MKKKRKDNEEKFKKNIMTQLLILLNSVSKTLWMRFNYLQAKIGLNFKFQATLASTIRGTKHLYQLYLT